jgi:hypothetical protein
MAFADLRNSYSCTAREMARGLVHQETLRNGGTKDVAMKAVARRAGVPWRSLHDLIYRPPKRVFACVFAALSDAYQRECARQEGALQAEISTAQTKGLSNDAANKIAAFARVAGMAANARATTTTD